MTSTHLLPCKSAFLPTTFPRVTMDSRKSACAVPVLPSVLCSRSDRLSPFLDCALRSFCVDLSRSWAWMTSLLWTSNLLPLHLFWSGSGGSWTQSNWVPADLSQVQYAVLPLSDCGQPNKQRVPSHLPQMFRRHHGQHPGRDHNGSISRTPLMFTHTHLCWWEYAIGIVLLGQGVGFGRSLDSVPIRNESGGVDTVAD